MKHQLVFSLLCLTAFTFSSCLKIKKVGSGNIVSDTRLVDSYSRVECDLATEVFWHYSTESKVVITTDDNIISTIKIQVNGDKLRITLKSGIRRIDPTTLVIHIYNDKIKEYSVNGSGSFECTDTIFNSSFRCKINGSGEANVLYKGEDFSAEINGSGEIQAYGNATEGSYDINGSGKIIASYLPVTNASATIDGSGRIYVNANGKLKININGSGDVYYTGSPQLTISINGSGTVHEF